MFLENSFGKSCSQCGCTIRNVLTQQKDGVISKHEKTHYDGAQMEEVVMDLYNRIGCPEVHILDM